MAVPLRSFTLRQLTSQWGEGENSSGSTAYAWAVAGVFLLCATAPTCCKATANLRLRGWMIDMRERIDIGGLIFRVDPSVPGHVSVYGVTQPSFHQT